MAGALTRMLGRSAASVWTTVRSMVGSSNNGWINTTTRETILAAGLTDVNGSRIRITFTASATSALDIAKAYVGLKGTNPGDFASTPTQLLFAGSAGKSVAANGVCLTDAAVFSYDGTHDLVVMVYTSGTSGFQASTSLSNSSIVFKTGDDTASLTVSGYSSAATHSVITLIEVLVP